MNTPQQTPANHSSNQQWLITFADLISLLLAFFVMVFAMSTVEGERWQAVVNALSRWFTPFEQIDDPRPTADKTIQTNSPSPAVQLDYLASVLQDRLGANSLIMDGGVQRLEDRLVISIPSAALFSEKQTVPAMAARAGLLDIAANLRNVNNAILVIGHASPGPAIDESVRSSWELSLSRAVAVATELRRAGYLREIPIFGSNAMRIDHLSPRFDDGRRGSWIERIDIVIRESRKP